VETAVIRKILFVLSSEEPVSTADAERIFRRPEADARHRGQP
jgi:hypothetical protein